MKSFAVRLISGAVLINLFVYALAFWSVTQAKRQYEEQIAITTRNLDQILNVSISGLFDRINASLVAVEGELEQQLANGPVNIGQLSAFMSTQQRNVADSYDLRVADAAGTLRYGSGMETDMPVSIRDRDFFVQLQHDGQSGIVISEPIQSRISGDWVVVAGRRYNFPDGSFAGAVLSPIPISHFVSVFSSVDSGVHGAISLWDASLAAVARYPAEDGNGSTGGKDNFSSILRDHIHLNPEGGTFNSPGNQEKIERIVSYLKINRYPLYIVVGSAATDYLGTWRRDAFLAAALIVIFTVTSLGAAWQLCRRWLKEKQAAYSLQQSEERYRELVMLANSIILRWLPDGRITFLNEFGQRFFGYTEAEIADRHVVGTIVLNTDGGGRNWELLPREILADPQKFEHVASENVRRNGQRIWVDWTNKAVCNGGGEIREILSIGSDITDRVLAEQQIRRLNNDLLLNAEVLEQRVAERTAELVVARDRAESADRIKSAFLATMSHELRTPLNSIIGFTGIMLQGLTGPLNPEQQKQMGMVQSSSRHLLSLINDILDISKIEAGQLDLARDTFDLNVSLDKMIRLVSPMAGKKGLALQFDIPPAASMITADRRRLEQVILNFLSNAVKFTDKGSVQVSCREEDSRFVISFSDTGIGMRPEELSGIFRPFYQLDSGLARKHEGTGLGLSICKKIIDMMGGTIEVESRWGQGSTFVIRIPKQAGDRS